MGDPRNRSGHFSWCTSGIAALGAHLLLLWITPNAPPESAVAAATQLEMEIVSQPPTPIVEPAPRLSGESEASVSPKPRAAVARAKRQPLQAAPVTPAANNADAAQATGEALDNQAGVLAALPAKPSGGVGAAGGHDADGAGVLMRAPRLLATRDPCAGYFPGTAAVTRGQVQLSVDVDAQGHPHPSQTLHEHPRGQGFENAAKACASQLHFAPALDAQGHPVSARARIALRFERS